MPLQDVLVLAVIVGAFSTFGAVLGFLTWYCGDKRKLAVQRRGHRDYGYPASRRLIVDDD
jgi:hypothetical protein